MRCKDKKRIVLVIASVWLLSAFTLMCHQPAAMAQQVTHYPQPARIVQTIVDGDLLYGLSGGDIVQIDLRSGTRKQFVSQLTLLEQYGIEDRFEFFLSDGQVHILDPMSRTIFLFQDDALIPLVALPDHLLLSETYHRCLATHGVLWITGRDQVYLIELSSGKLIASLPDHTIQYHIHPAGMVVQRRINDQRRLHLYDPKGVELCSLAEMRWDWRNCFGVDMATGDVYAQVDGMLSILEDGQWQTIQPIQYWDGLWENHLVIVKEDAITLLPITAWSQHPLVIRGGSTAFLDDQAFMLANPTIGLQRMTMPTTAEDAYNAIVANDDSIDLFCLRMNYGVKTLIDKGFASAKGLESMQPDVDRMFPYIRDAIMRNGEVFAYPAYMRHLQSWWRHQAYAVDFAPDTMLDLLDAACTWEDDAHELPILCSNGQATPWSKREFAVYVLTQWIHLHGEGNIQFTDTAMERIFQKILDLPPDMPEVLSDEESHAVYIRAWETILFSPFQEQYRLILPPEVCSGSDVVLPAEMFVYIVNPHSKKQEEITTYLQYVAANRLEYQLPWIYRDVVATQRAQYQEILADLAGREQDARDAIDKAKPEDMRELEDLLASIIDERERLTNAGIRWDYHPQNLAFFQTHCAPRISLPLSPLLSAEEGTFHGLWPNLSDLLDQYLAGQLSPHECLARMDHLWQLHQME